MGNTRTRSCCVVLVCMLCTIGVAEKLLAVPYGYWSFNDPQNIGHDDSGNNHDGTLAGSQAPQWMSDGEGGGYLSLANGWVQIGNRYDDDVMPYGPNDDFAWTCRFRPGGGNSDAEMIMSRRRHLSDTDDVNMSLTYNGSDGRLRMFFSAQNGSASLGPATVVFSADSWNDGDWHEVLVSRNAAQREFRMYVDTVLQAVATDPGWDFSSPSSFRVGQEGELYGGNHQFHGDIDEVMVLVPEPATMLLFVGALFAMRRRAFVHW